MTALQQLRQVMPQRVHLMQAVSSQRVIQTQIVHRVI